MCIQEIVNILASKLGILHTWSPGWSFQERPWFSTKIEGRHYLGWRGAGIFTSESSVFFYDVHARSWSQKKTQGVVVGAVLFPFNLLGCILVDSWLTLTCRGSHTFGQIWFFATLIFDYLSSLMHYVFHIYFFLMYKHVFCISLNFRIFHK